jgi:hypothetical protein
MKTKIKNRGKGTGKTDIILTIKAIFVLSEANMAKKRQSSGIRALLEGDHFYFAAVAMYSHNPKTHSGFS